MIDLYAMISPNVQKIYIMLEECALPYTAHQVDIWKGEQFSSEILQHNPNAKVPVIVDHESGDGAPLSVFESGAILIYLAEKTGKFLPSETRARSEVMQWLMVQVANVGPMFGQFNHFRKFATDVDYGAARYTTQAERLYRLLDDRLSRHTYLGGDDYSIADIAVFPWLRSEAAMFGEDTAFMQRGNVEYANLWAWFDKIEARPQVQKAVVAFEKHGSTLGSATSDEVDRVLGRGKYAYAR